MHSIITLDSETASCNLQLKPFDNRRLLSLCGNFDEHLHQIENRLDVQISTKGNSFHISGKKSAISTAKKVLLQLYSETEKGKEISINQVHLSIKQYSTTTDNLKNSSSQASSIKTPTGTIIPKTKNQHNYVQQIIANSINFAIGPAGTGKTFLAVACAVTALEQQKIQRIILVRPVVEAGEKLGFLPGDLTQKIDPYLRPLYDALYEMLGFERVTKFLEQQIIEIAPLAYMRGRTLNDSFIILDESQNTTIGQMKMFLTRIGFNSVAVVTGDITQIDLPTEKYSGLQHANDILQNIPNISFSYLQAGDVIRHPIVQKVIDAYTKDKSKHK